MTPHAVRTRAWRGTPRLRRIRTVVLGFGGTLLLALLVLGVATQPSHDRAWRTEQAVLPQIEFAGDVVHVRNVRDFTYRSATDFTAAYADRSYDLNGLDRVWFVLSPFNRDWRGPAHSFLSFSFADSQYVSISVEARREVGEEYSIWKGVLRQYELMYVIGEERDLIGLRAVTWDDPVYVYPIRASAEQVRALFVAMLERAHGLEQRPEFYNTIFNNCTSNIRDPVNRIAAQRIPFGLDVLLPGYSDRLAHERGLIDTELSLDAARTRFRVNDRAKQAIDDPQFSVRLRM